MSDQKKLEGLDLLRAPFADCHISKLPKESKAQAEERKRDRSAGVSCKVCGSFHHKNAVHLDYVGHAAVTHRLLEADPSWYWEPLAVNEVNLPRFDESGGLWIKLVVCGVTRLGYGHAAFKATADPGAREKEVIGDALRNAAMRFGAALDLWHKGDLHGDDDDGGDDSGDSKKPVVQQPGAQKAPQNYSADEFEKNLPNWSERIRRGKNTPDDLIAFADSKGLPLTDDQKKKLKAIKQMPTTEQGA